MLRNLLSYQLYRLSMVVHGSPDNGILELFNGQCQGPGLGEGILNTWRL